MLIKWQNLGVSTLAKFFFSALNVLIALSIIIVLTIILVRLNHWQKDIQMSNAIPEVNTDKVITKEQAYKDQTGETIEGYMSTYCSQ